jgi:hypothetical protein
MQFIELHLAYLRRKSKWDYTKTRTTFWSSSIAIESSANWIKREKENVVESTSHRKNVNAFDLQSFALKTKTQRKTTIRWRTKVSKKHYKTNENDFETSIKQRTNLKIASSCNLKFSKIVWNFMTIYLKLKAV